MCPARSLRADLAVVTWSLGCVHVAEQRVLDWASVEWADLLVIPAPALWSISSFVGPRLLPHLVAVGSKNHERQRPKWLKSTLTGKSVDGLKCL